MKLSNRLKILFVESELTLKKRTFNLLESPCFQWCAQRDSNSRPAV